MSFCNYWEDEILDHVFNKGSYTAETIHVGLSTADPGEDGSGTSEPGGNGYARVSTAAGDWNASSSGSITNNQDIIFPQATGSWGTITHVFLNNASSAGSYMASGALSASKSITSGDTPYFAGGTPGDLECTLD